LLLQPLILLIKFDIPDDILSMRVEDTLEVVLEDAKSVGVVDTRH
jgi:hypothetical protein